MFATAGPLGLGGRIRFTVLEVHVRETGPAEPVDGLDVSLDGSAPATSAVRRVQQPALLDRGHSSASQMLRSASSNSILQISFMSVIVTVMVIMEVMRCRYLIAFMPSVRVSVEGEGKSDKMGIGRQLKLSE